MFIPLAIDILKEPKTTTNIATPTAPTFAVPTGLDTFFLFFKSPLRIHSFVLSIPHVTFHVSLQVQLLLRCLHFLSLRLAAALPLFLIQWVRLLLSSPGLTSLRTTTLILWISRVLGPLMLISMAFESLRSAFPVWRLYKIAMGTSCRGFLLADPQGSTSSSYWEAWWMILSITSLIPYLLRGFCNGRLQFRSWSRLALQWSSYWITCERHITSASFLVLLALATLEIRPLSQAFNET